MIWTRRSTLLPLAGSAFLAVGIWAQSSASAGAPPAVTASGGVVAAGAEVSGESISRTAQAGYWWNEPPGVPAKPREPDRIADISAAGRVSRSVVRTLAGDTTIQYRNGASGRSVSRHVRTVTGAAEIDRTPIFEEDAFILGWLLGDE